MNNVYNLHEDKSPNYYSSNTLKNSKTINSKTINYEKGIVKNILNKINLFQVETNIFYAFMMVYTGTYLISETLQSSSLIKQTSHNQNNTTLFGYDLLFTWLVTYFLLNQQKIAKNYNNGDTLLYWLSTIIGAVGFALLGEISFLSKIVITKDWWRNLSISAWIYIGIIGSIIIGIGLIELETSCRDGKLRTNLLNIILIGVIYSFILNILIVGKAHNIHYHVHHAIFAGVLSLWFTDWKNKLVMVMHGILMGIVVEGINFFGIGELFLFMTTGSVNIPFVTSLSITIIFYSVLILAYTISRF